MRVISFSTRSIQPAIFKIICYLALMLFCLKCSSPTKNLKTLTVKETAGVNRDLEYIRVQVAAGQVSPLSIRDENGRALIPGQLLSSQQTSQDEFLLEYIFPVSVGANETRQFELVFEESPLQVEKLTVSGDDLALKVENSYFIADLTAIKATADNGIQPGQLAGLVLKQFNNQLLERGHIAMHWAPSFQKGESGYKTMAHLRPDSFYVSREGPYQASIFRRGYVTGYEEILVNGTYKFFAGLPYFTFSSAMKIEKNVELTLLRNNEMTMDSLFTHLVFPDANGTVREFSLYDPQTPEMLDKDRIPDDVAWICFYHADHQYAFGSIKLKYDNTNLSGGQSPTFQKHTKISRASNGGRYWDRRLIHLQETLVPKGSRYSETNAYLIFAVNPEDSSASIREYFQRLNNPLEVDY